MESENQDHYSVSARARFLRFDPVKSSVDATEVSQCVFCDATKLPPLKCLKNPVNTQLSVTLTTFPFFTFALAGCLQSFHPTHAQLSKRNGKFVFSGTFHIMWVKVGQGILLNRSIFLNKSDQLCINIT